MMRFKTYESIKVELISPLNSVVCGHPFALLYEMEISRVLLDPEDWEMGP